MSIKKLADSIKDLDTNEYERFISYGCSFRIKEYGENLKRSDYKYQLAGFLKYDHENRAKKSSISYANLDSYLFALGKLRGNRNDTNNIQETFKLKTWNELLLKVTDDIDLPWEIENLHLSKENLKIIRNIISNLIIASVGENRDETKSRLILLDDFVNKFIINNNEKV